MLEEEYRENPEHLVPEPNPADCVFTTVQQSRRPLRSEIISKATLLVNWPQYRYDLNHSGCNPYESILSPNTVGNLALDWTYAVGNYHYPSYSAPSVVNGILYSAGTGSLYALNASTGALLWSYSTRNLYDPSAPAVANGVVYVGSSESGVAGSVTL